MTRRWSLFSTSAGVLATLLLSGMLAKAVSAPAEAPAESEETIIVLSDSISKIALMTSDLDESGVGRATLHEELGEIVVRTTPETPRNLRGTEVLVYYSELWGGWRLMSTDIGILTPELRR